MLYMKTLLLYGLGKGPVIDDLGALLGLGLFALVLILFIIAKITKWI